MGILDNLWRSSVEVLKDSAVNVGVNTVRRQVDAARQALREGHVEKALDLASTVITVGNAIAPRSRLEPLIGAAHGVVSRAKRASDDPDGARASAEQAARTMQAADGHQKLDGAELSEWGLALVLLGDPGAHSLLRRAVDSGGAIHEAYVQLAIEERRVGNVLDAEGYLRDALALFPEGPEANGELGDIMQASDRPDEAAFFLGAAGFEYGRRGDLDAALPLLERARDLAPGDPAPLIGIAEVHRVQGDLESALEIAEESRRLGPGTSATHFVAGWILLDLGDPAAAKVAFDEGLALAPDDSSGLAGAARALAAMDRVDDAGSVARRAVDAGTDDGVTTALAAMAFEEGDDEDEAIRLYEAALEIDPEVGFARERLVGLLVSRADDLLDRGSEQEATDLVRRALDADPRAATAHAEQARIFAQAGRWPDSLAAADRAVDCDPDLAWGHLQRADALRGLGRVAKAVDAAVRATEAAPNNADVWTLLGDLHLEQNDARAAADAYRTALDRDPEHRAAVIRLSEALDRLDLDHEAVPFLTDFVDRHPDDAEVLRHLGMRLYWSNRDAESLDVLLRALKLDPAQHDARRHVGLVYVALDQWSDAVAWLGPLIDEEGQEADGYARASLAFALMALERHSEAAPLTRSVIDAEPQFAFGWQIRAQLLSESGWYRNAIEAAREAIRWEPQTSWPYQTLAWAIERAGEPREAIDAWHAAEEKSDGDLWATKGRANALAKSGEHELANDLYHVVLDALDAKTRGGSESSAATSLNSDDLALAGWCRLCLGEYADAVKLLISSVVVRADPVVQFDMALAMLCAGQTKQAAREYERGVEWLDGIDPLHRRGVLTVGIGDIDRFRTRLDGKAVDVAGSCRARLAAEFNVYEHLHPDNLPAVDHTTAALDDISATETTSSAPLSTPEGTG
jgi:tetratricopeptide (TPR) repeat protein